MDDEIKSKKIELNELYKNELYKNVLKEGRKSKIFDFTGISGISEKDLKIFLNSTMWDAYEEENKKNKLWRYLLATITLISFFYAINNLKQNYNQTILQKS